MQFTIISDREVSGKVFGDTLDEKDLLDAGVNIEALVAGGHIQEIAPSTKTAPEGAN